MQGTWKHPSISPLTPSRFALTMLSNNAERKAEQSAARKSRQATTLQSGHPARRAELPQNFSATSTAAFRRTLLNEELPLVPFLSAKLFFAIPRALPF